ncbi:MAG TPA: hypothetical protein VLS93_17945 [Anaeromyxobacteraceae bacterium]|nr:hypothetical protein [Anaeromyxobacteraceae bacterium]
MPRPSGKTGPHRSTTRLAAALLLLAACGRDDVAHFRVAKAPATPVQPPAMAGQVPPPPSPGGRALRWTLPPGWTEGQGDAMRVATLRPPVPGRVDVSVTVLAGTAGGELANVNRWRGQIGLPALDEPALEKARGQVRTGVGPVSLFDFTSEGSPASRLVAGLASVEGSTWFVKMTGDAAAVGAARADFLRLVESLRLEVPN